MINKTDSEKILTAIKALNYTLTEGIELAKEIYTVAFSKTFALNGSPAEILDAINNKDFKGKSTEFSAEAVAETEANIKDMTVSSIEEIGDLLITEEFVYIFDGTNMIKLVKPYTETCGMVDTYNIKCATLRPLKILDYIPYLPEKELELTQGQKAVIGTAKQYLLRGYRTQYDDTTIGHYAYRWRIRSVAPEDYTQDLHGYSNCAAFALDSHYFSWGYNTESMSTRQLATQNTENFISWEITGSETEAEKEAIKEEFFANLLPADIINIRYNHNSSGHAMLYVGNGQIIHSSGRNYCYDEENPYETYEPTVRCMNVLDLFKENDRRYIFKKIKNLAIVRPLNVFDGNIPQNTLSRIENLKGVVSEKLCSKKKYNSVAPGEEITYTFSLYNTNTYDVNIEIKDEIPHFTTLLSGDAKCMMHIPANERKCVSYTVKVNEDAPSGEYIISNKAYIGNVLHSCPSLLIGNPLKADITINTNSSLSDFELLNEIYNNKIPAKSVNDITKDLFTADEEGYFTLNKDGKFAKMLVPGFIGGSSISASRYYDEIARFVRPENLMTGDIIVFSRKIDEKIYLVTNDGIFDLTDKKYVKDTEKFTECLIATNNYFAVLRPYI